MTSRPPVGRCTPSATQPPVARGLARTALFAPSGSDRLWLSHSPMSAARTRPRPPRARGRESASICRTACVACPHHSGDQSAVEHLVGDWRRDPVDECRTHLRVTAKKCHELLLLRGRRLRFLLPQLLAACLLVFEDHFVRDSVENRILSGRLRLSDSRAGCGGAD